MGKWERELDAAGITQPRLREDYTRQREQARAYKREIVIAADLLLPERLVPHVLTAMAFMHGTDVLIDSGPLAERREKVAHWRKEVADTLETGETDNPDLRALLGTIGAYPDVRRRVLDYLAAADVDLDFTGFATEADYQAYIEGYSLPGFMLVATLLGPQEDPDSYYSTARTYIDAIQRLDFVNDLAEDLAEGRLTIPEQVLEQHGVTRADLEQARDLPGVRALIAEQLGLVEQGLAESLTMVDIVPTAHRPMLGCMIDLDVLTIAAIRRDPAAVLRRSASPGKAAALRVLLRGYLQARRIRPR